MKIGTLSKSLALAAPLVALAPADLDAAAYIKFDGIDGEATAAGFEGFTKISYYKIMIDGLATNNKLGSPTIAFDLDKASPRLALACATGTAIPSVTIIFTRPDGSGAESAYYKVTFSTVRITSYQNERQDGTDTPKDALTLGYTEVEWTYTVRDSNGNQTGTVSTGVLTR